MTRLGVSAETSSLILLEELDDATFADEVADRILELVRQPLLIQNVNLRVSASIGIVVSDAHETTPDALMRDADIAMYRAKADGRDRRVAFEPAMHASATKQLRISQDLAHALDRDELALYYQAIVDLEDGTPQGVEALIRWHHRESRTGRAKRLHLDCRAERTHPADRSLGA